MGLSAEAVQRFAAVAASHVGDESVPGLVALVAHGDDVHVEALGSLTIGGPPVERTSLFRIASTTKPITAATTLALVEDGLLDLDGPVERWLPELKERRVLRRPDGPLDDTVPAERPFTVRELLTFTFGFGMAMEMFMAAEPWPVVAAAAPLRTIAEPQPDLFVDPETWLARFAELPLVAQPGERWLYNSGAHVLSVLCARAAGAPFDEVMRSRVLDPLGMHDTAFFTTDAARLATAYAGTPDGLAVWDTPDGQWSHPPVFPDGAAGLVSTVDDLLSFARVFSRGTLLSSGLRAEMCRDHLTADQRTASEPFLGGRGWGLGQAVTLDGPWAGAVGWDGGLGSSLLVHPERDVVCIVLTQRLFDSPTLPAAHADLQTAALSAALA